MNGQFVNEMTYIGCGYDNAPLLFKKEGDKWLHKGSLDAGLDKMIDPKINQSAFENVALFEDAPASERFKDATCKVRGTKH